MVDTLRYLFIVKSMSAMWLSFPAVCLMLGSKVISKSCHFLSSWLSGIRKLALLPLNEPNNLISRPHEFNELNDLYVSYQP